MSDREKTLRGVAVGDIFHARCTNGARLICLVTSIAETTIQARRVTSQEDLEFDRQSGIERATGQSRIDCVTPFPLEVHEAFLELDRKGQEFKELDRLGIEPDPTAYRLTDAQKRALLSIEGHVLANAI